MSVITRMMGCFVASLAVAGLAGATASAEYVTNFGVQNHFLDPAGWNVGDSGSTYQEWDSLTVPSGIGNSPDRGYATNPTGLNSPTLSVKSPGFHSGSNNFYSFSSNYGATADIYNHTTGSYGPEYGTHVILQTGSSQNPDAEGVVAGHMELVAGHGFGNFWDTMKLVDLVGNPIAGGDNASALQIAEISYQPDVASSFGAVDYQELIYEFWLPGYTGDFRVDWGQIVHGTIDTLRVDSMVAAAAVGGGSPFPLTSAVPEPGSAGLLMTGAISAVGAVVMRRRRKR